MAERAAGARMRSHQETNSIISSSCIGDLNPRLANEESEKLAGSSKMK